MHVGIHDAVLLTQILCCAGCVFGLYCMEYALSLNYDDPTVKSLDGQCSSSVFSI